MHSSSGDSNPDFHSRFGAPSPTAIYTRADHRNSRMAMKKEKVRKARQNGQSVFQKDLKKAVRENKDILEALD